MDHERELLEQQLWELQYELLPEEEAHALRGRIESEPEVGALYEQVVRGRKIVAEAVQWPCDEIPLAPPAGLSINGKPASKLSGIAFGAGPRSRRGVRLGRWMGLFASLGAAVLLAWTGHSLKATRAFFNSDAVAKAEQRFLEEARRVVISGPQRLVEGAPQSFSVAVSTLAGEPAPSEVHYAFFASDGENPLEAGRAVTGNDGRLTLHPPVDWESSSGRLEVRSPEDAEALVANFAVTPPRYTARVALDKTVYNPGETVRFRVQALSPFGFAPHDALALRVQLQDAAGLAAPEAASVAELQGGIADGSVTLPSTLQAGVYWFHLAAQDRVLQSEREELLVRESSPAPHIASRGIEILDHNSRVRRKMAAPLAAAPPAPLSQSATDKPLADAGTFYFEVEGVAESLDSLNGVRESLPLANESFREKRLADGQWAALEELNQLAKKVAPAAAGDEMEIGDTTALGVSQPQGGASLSLVDREIAEGSPLKVQIIADQELPLALSAASNGALIAQREIVLSWRGESNEPVQESVELQLPDGVTGPVYVGLYDYSQSPPALLAGDIVMAAPRRQLHIEAKPASGESSLQGLPALEVSVTDENGAPVQALLSVAGRFETDRDFAELDRQLAKQTARGFGNGGGGAGLDRLANAPDYEAAKAASDDASTDPTNPAFGGIAAAPAEVWKYERATKNQDLLLDGAAASFGRSPAAAGFEAPVIIDNAAKVQARAETQFAQLREQREQIEQKSRTLTRRIVSGAAVLLGLLVASAFARPGLPTWLWTSTLTGLLVAIGIGIAGTQTPSPRSLPLNLTAFPAESPASTNLAVMGDQIPAPSVSSAGASPSAASSPQSQGGFSYQAGQNPAGLAPAPNQAAASLRAGGGDSKNDQLDVWMPRLATDEQGKASIPLPPASAPVTVRLSVEGQGNGRAGAAEVEMRLAPRQ